MKQAVSVVTIVAIACVLSSHGAGTLDNGTIKLQSMNGDGTIGALQYPISSPNHLTDCGLRIRYNSKLSKTTALPATEATYNDLGLFTGYGREHNSFGSNFFVCSAAYLDAGNSYLDQTIVLLTRTYQYSATVIHYMDADVQGTKSDDAGYSGVNNMVSQAEGGTNIALVADGSLKFTVDSMDEVQNQMATESLSNATRSNKTDTAAAVSWNPTSLSQTPKTILSRLIAAPSLPDAAGMTTIMQDQNRRVHVPDPARIVIKKLSFTQKLNMPNVDTLTLKGTVDLSQYPTEMLNLYNTDISLFIADYLALTPSDMPCTNGDKQYMQKFKLVDGFFGKRTVILSFDKTKKILTFQLTVIKANIQCMTYLNAAASQRSQIYLPFALVVTGMSGLDTAKGRKCWIIANSILVDCTKTTTAIKGTLPVSL